MLLQACIISGCDYHAGVPGIGYKKAVQLIKSHRPIGDIESLCEELHRLGKVSDAKTYQQEYWRCESTFKHQIVYDPKERRERFLTE
jgi:exonuclease 1